MRLNYLFPFWGGSSRKSDMCKWRSRAWAGRDRTKVDAFCVLQWKARVRCGAPPSLGGEALKYWHTSKFDKISAQHKKKFDFAGRTHSTSLRALFGSLPASGDGRILLRESEPPGASSPLGTRPQHAFSTPSPAAHLCRRCVAPMDGALAETPFPKLKFCLALVAVARSTAAPDRPLRHS